MADLEKESRAATSSTSSTKAPSPHLHEKEDEILTDGDVELDADLSPTSSRSSSHDSDASDPLEALEHAMSHPNTSTPADLARFRTGTSIGTTASRMPEFEVDFALDDPDNPKNWPLWYRSLSVFALSFATWNIVFYSTSYTASMPGMMKEWGIEDEALATLGVTTYLLGLAAGSLVLAPVSEIYGRRPVYLGCLCFFSLLILPCALATGLPEVIVVRFFGYVRFYIISLPVSLNSSAVRREAHDMEVEIFDITSAPFPGVHGSNPRACCPPSHPYIIPSS